MTELVSVIVPTYNRSNDALNIVRKLTSQDYVNIEIIVINDGSNDDTINVLKKITDNRLIVINKPNSGVSDTRNVGLANASGEYVLFVDDDDDIPADYVSSVMRKEYDGIDLIIDSYCTQLDNNEPQKIEFPLKGFADSCETIDYICGEMPDRPYAFFVHGKRFKMSVIRSQSVKFSDTIGLGEDRCFVMDYILASKTCRIVNNHKYIVKSQTQSQYRLSKGLKKSDWLWHNILDSYSYLHNVCNTTGIISVRRYADNYAATRTLDFLFNPFCAGLYTSEKDNEIVHQMMGLVTDKVCVENVRRKDAKLYVLLMKMFGKQSVGIWRSLACLRKVVKL